MPVTVAVMKSTSSPRSALRNSVSSACASNQPSPLRPKAPAAMPSVGEPAETPRQRVRILEHDVGALGHLRRVIGLQDRQRRPRRQGSDSRVSRKPISASGAELVLRAAGTGSSVNCDRRMFSADRELLADRGAGQRRRRVGELRVALDQRDRAAKTLPRADNRRRRCRRWRRRR